MGTALEQLPDLGLSFEPALLNAEYAAWRADHSSALEHAKNVGRMLCEAKDRLTHGQWKTWVGVKPDQGHFDGSYDTAKVAMQVYGAWLHHHESLVDADGQLPQSIRGTLAAIRRGGKRRNEPALTALDNAEVEDEPETVYALSLEQLTTLARAAHAHVRMPEEPWVLAHLKAQGLAA